MVFDAPGRAGFAKATPNKMMESSKARMVSMLPIFEWFPRYKVKEQLHHDVIAGATVGVMCVPQAMSYATVAGLSPVFGLYNALVGLLPYPLLGTSAYLISGPTAVMSILVKSSLPPTLNGLPLIPNSSDPASAAAYQHACFLMAFIAGSIQLLMGGLGFGVLVNLISEPVILGFTSAAAFVIAGTQFSNLLGLSKCHVAGGGSCLFHEEVSTLPLFAGSATSLW